MLVLGDAVTRTQMETMTKYVGAMALAMVVAVTAVRAQTGSWPFAVTDLRDRDTLTVLVFGDAGTGRAGQYRVGEAMADVCSRSGCDFAVTLGDNIYENGIEVDERDDPDASYREIMTQFDDKFERPYQRFKDFPGFHFWISLGNHDYRRNAVVAMTTYSEFSTLWRLPSLHYEVPLLPDWIQVHALHTDTDVRRDLNGLQVASAKRSLCDPDHPDRWKVVFGHHPVYNSGHHRNDGNERRTRALVEGPLLQDCGVHVYLAGHAHHQEHLTVRGFEQVIQGAAGQLKGRNRSRTEPHVRQRFFSKTFGFAVLTFDPAQLRIDFYDVLNTRAKADTVVAPTDAEVVRSYSWCGTRSDVGHPDRSPPPCLPER